MKMLKMKKCLLAILSLLILVSLVGCSTYTYKGEVTEIREYYVGGIGFAVGDVKTDIVFDGYKVFTLNHNRLHYEYKKHDFEFEVGHYYEGEFDWTLGTIKSIKEIVNEGIDK